jgi:hypothetical protein
MAGPGCLLIQALRGEPGWLSATMPAATRPYTTDYTITTSIQM